MLVHWNNSPRIDISSHSDTWSWFRANQSLLFHLNAACFRGKTTNTNFIVFGLMWSGLELTIYRTYYCYILYIYICTCFHYFSCNCFYENNIPNESHLSIVVIYYIIDIWFHLYRHQTRLTTYLNLAKTIVLFIHYKSVTFSLSFQFNCLETENYIHVYSKQKKNTTHMYFTVK